MKQHISLGQSNDEKAVSIFVEGDQIHNANIFYSVLSGKGYKTREANFFTKNSEHNH